MMNTEIKYFTYIKKMLPEYEAIINHNKTMVDLTVFDEHPFKFQNKDGYRNESDHARIAWLIENPFWRWIDADTEILKLIDFRLEQDKAYFYGIHGHPDICMILGNGDKQLFIDMLACYNENDSGWAQAFLERNRTRIGLIPSDYDKQPDGCIYFRHHALNRKFNKKD